MAGIFGLLMSGAGVIKDQYFNLTTLLLPGNGTNGAQNNTFLDGSTNNFTITRNGNTTQGTFSPFSQTGWGNYFSGSNYIYISNTSVFDLPGDFTIEFWWYPLTLSATTQSVCGKWGVSQFAWLVQATSTSLTLQTGPAPLTTITNSWSPVNGRWYHIAFTRSGTDVRAFVNGSQIGTTQTSSKTCSSTANTGIGANPDGPQEYSNSYISNFRITKGQALYTSAFTPSVIPITTTSQGATAGNVSILTCQSNRFIDNSTNNLTVNPVGGVSVVAFSPFAPTAAYTTAAVGGSGYFDGTGDYLTAPASNIFDFAAGQAFTLDCWFYQTASTTIAITQGGANTFSIDLTMGSGGSINYGKAGVANIISASASIPINSWNYLVISRNTANQSRMWLNGVSIGSSSSDTYSFNNVVQYIGSNANPGSYITGYLSAFRILKGTALYDPTLSSNITVPTSPPTAITNTKLLLNFTNAGITDATAKNDLETVGNAQISTSVSKFGGGSIAFDGNNDSLNGPSSTELDMGTGNWTVEGWINITTRTLNYPLIIGNNNGTFSAGAVAFTASNADSASYNDRFNLAIFDLGVTKLIPATGTANATGIWYHFAVVRNGTNISIYRDGVSVASATVSASLTINWGKGGVRVGGNNWDGAQSYLNGYIDDLRITKGYARYTSNFTAPTAPFPVQ